MMKLQPKTHVKKDAVKAIGKWPGESQQVSDSDTAGKIKDENGKCGSLRVDISNLCVYIEPPFHLCLSVSLMPSSYPYV